MADSKPSRLRIGGVSPGISEKELRKRFKSFGEVSGVWREEEGDVIVDLLASDVQLQNCVSRYHQTKWKGNRVSVRLDHQTAGAGKRYAQDGVGGQRADSSSLDRRESGQYLTTPSSKRRKRVQDERQQPKGSRANHTISSSGRNTRQLADTTPNGSTTGDESPSGGEDPVQRALFTSDCDEDEESHQLQEEKVKALAILDSVLQASTEDSLPESVQDTTVLSTESTSTSHDLKSLFDQDTPYTFDFQASDSENERSGEEVPTWTPAKKLQHTPVHSTEHVRKKPPKLFFFHSGNSSLKNRLENNWFYRSRPLEELERGWAQRRTAVRQAYKARHRDALRIARKSKKRERTNHRTQ